ncbi:MAG: ABC transporter ATP-binding protein [Candidatus ainarchaeum sp.]|jgi:oligopeptide/dipeptide ABC transporter ATP-binding protein|nr:ABC transporter ATP-binding protein [Candidatus ainarchaeum sp.]
MIMQVSNLTKTFTISGKKQIAVDKVNLSIKRGECLGLIGESGSGKSTIANLIAGLLKPDSGSIIFNSSEFVKASAKDLQIARKEMQMVFQNPQESFNPRMKLIGAISEPLIYQKKYKKSEIEQLVYGTLERVGLKGEYAAKYAWEISGGECQRAAIARAIIGNPKLILCDEITSALDVSVQAQIISLLHQLKEETDMSFLFISHDLAIVSSICDNVAVMYKGQIMESGDTLSLINNPLHPYTRDLIFNALKPGEKRIEKVSDCNGMINGCKYYEFCNISEKQCREIPPEEVNMNSHIICCSKCSHSNLPLALS